MKRWFVIDARVNGKLVFIGKCYDIETEVRKACGPWHTIEGNHIVIFSPPPKASRATA